ncbi:hypothetical protein GYH30_020237 [Glycine max]|uniref:Uncharacterized protein n=1 Tax=Glycine max TaxID=3847 RepID=A0A0R0IGY4_SOYBN|nr:hypothetical protein GYH30_020237 [Glycine max]
MARAHHHHHDPELLKIDGAVAVAVPVAVEQRVQTHCLLHRSSIRFSSSLFFSFSKLLNYHLSTIDPTNRSFASRFTCIWFNCHFFSLQLKDDIHHVCYNSLGLR